MKLIDNKQGVEQRRHNGTTAYNQVELADCSRLDTQLQKGIQL